MYNEKKRKRKKDRSLEERERERERRIATLVEEIGRDGIEDRGRDGGNLTQAKKRRRERDRERKKEGNR